MNHVREMDCPAIDWFVCYLIVIHMVFNGLEEVNGNLMFVSFI